MTEVAMLRSQRWLPYFFALALVGLACSLVPARPALAMRLRNQPITDLVPEFASGLLERTSLTPIGASSADPDQGGVELTPVAYIKEWRASAFHLPLPLTDHGAVAFNGNVYVVGGAELASGATI